MDMGEKGKNEVEKRSNEDPMNYHSPNMSSDWRFSTANLLNVTMGMVPSGNPMSSSSCSSSSMVDSYSPTLWDHPTNLQNLGYCDINAQYNASPSSTLGIRRGGPGSLRSVIDRTVDMVWNPPNSMLKGGIFLPNASGMLPQGLSHFPADSGFIERAARFSSFNGGSFSDVVNPFCVPDSMALYSRGGGMISGQQEVCKGNGLKSVPSNGVNVGEASRDVSASLEQGATEGSPLKNEIRSESQVKSHEDAKQGVGGSGNESDEAEFSGGGGQDEPAMLEGASKEPSTTKIGLKKRKRSGQDTELDQIKEAAQPGDSAKDKTEIPQTGDQNPTSATNRTTGKQGKQGPQASDSPKDEYIHVRARRGQATNSHSLAERVRREKISERMKFLQDLVPGCNKVTGKAVMLDEIINYVQSLQRQVEFLSMKLSTVNPRLDFNIEGLLAKDILQSRAGPSSLGYTPDMPMAFPPLHQSPPGLIQAGIPGMGGSSNVHRRNINPQLTPISGGFKEPSQLPNMWEDELHNVVQMNYGTSTPLPSQEVNESSTPGQMKVEL